MDTNSNGVLGELRGVNMLLILNALAQGCQQKHVAATLNVNEATLSRMFPKGFEEIAKVSERKSGSAEAA